MRMSGDVARKWMRSATTTYPVAVACAAAEVGAGEHDGAAAAEAVKRELTRAAAALRVTGGGALLYSSHPFFMLHTLGITRINSTRLSVQLDPSHLSEMY